MLSMVATCSTVSPEGVSPRWRSWPGARYEVGSSGSGSQAIESAWRTDAGASSASPAYSSTTTASRGRVRRR
jgi:hypothetical protein